MNVLSKIKKAGLAGRGGACFSTAVKWDMAEKVKGERKFVVCNAAEGEPGVKKDGYILEHFPEKVVDGMKIAIDFLGAEKGYIYINKNYYKKYSRNLARLIGDDPIELFIKPADSGYIGGEEGSALNAIEGKRVEPRVRPPFPTTNGLWDCPTLINNVETFYNVSLAASDEYENKRFYTISGDCLHDGVYAFPDDWTIQKILKETKNYPDFSFFAQIGGGASGEILASRQLKRQVSGAGSIAVYSTIKRKPMDLIKKWLEFFINESCGQCVPCREGVYRLLEISKSKDPDWQLFEELLDNLSETASCGLGCVVPIPIKSYVKNVLAKMPENKINLPKGSKKIICECFK